MKRQRARIKCPQLTTRFYAAGLPRWDVVNAGDFDHESTQGCSSWEGALEQANPEPGLRQTICLLIKVSQCIQSCLCTTVSYASEPKNWSTRNSSGSTTANSGVEICKVHRTVLCCTLWQNHNTIYGTWYLSDLCVKPPDCKLYVRPIIKLLVG